MDKAKQKNQDTSQQEFEKICWIVYINKQSNKGKNKL